ncbi:alpha/beta hydrolase-fold protein [Bowmanella yangjiangensis]|uniref:Esterase n=1 Tax=Bowmanella yangjiangensis TaxID=2811230 RepID=A0ABS3CRL3_9ALTE|nr:alpha/beta hydrolase-fold protein [Bowmanella yangjiangensis]MBN7819737.1 hypothetical protein [Bowmanella yangjiangensis]
MKNTVSCFMYSLVLLVLSVISNPGAAGEKSADDPFHYSVNLPQSYNESTRTYPVIFLIDSSPFYKGDYFGETTETIRRLEKFHDFPETIIVEVEVKQLYRYVTRERNTLSDWLGMELSPLIAKQYRTQTRNVIVGFSYTAGGLMNSVALRKNSFSTVISLSPVFESVRDVPAALSNVDLVPRNLAVFGNENHRLIQFYQPLLKSSDTAELSIISLPQENHQSVLVPGLRASLLRTFSDYQLPSYSSFLEHDYTPQTLMELFKHRTVAYGVAPEPSALSDLFLEAAKVYTQMGKFELAEQHWRFTESEHKSYFIAQIIDELERGQQVELAQKARALRQKLGL